jgi:hypothetical protein
MYRVVFMQDRGVMLVDGYEVVGKSVRVFIKERGCLQEMTIQSSLISKVENLGSMELNFSDNAVRFKEIDWNELCVIN